MTTIFAGIPLLLLAKTAEPTFTSKLDRKKSQMLLIEHLPSGEKSTMAISVPNFQVRALAARRVNSVLFVVLQIDEFQIERRIYLEKDSVWTLQSTVRLCGMRGSSLDRLIKSAWISDDASEVVIITFPYSNYAKLSLTESRNWQDAVLVPRREIDKTDTIEERFFISGSEVHWNRSPNSILPE